MAKKSKIEAKLDQLKTLRQQPISPGLLAELRSLLADGSALVVAATAELVEKREVAELAQELVDAFTRLMIDAEETDPNCVAKIALVRALNAVNYQNEAIFLQGLTHFQNRKFQSEDDAASPLRGDCAFALARIGYPKLVVLLVDRLVEKSPVARKLAAQALGASGRSAAIPLLRLKVQVGDLEPEVTGECLTSLMSLDPKESLEFVASYLSHPQSEVCEAALFALAESRSPEALALLLKRWPAARQTEFEEVLLLGIAMTKQAVGLEFLVKLLSEKTPSSHAALKALAIHRYNADLKARIAEIVEKSGDAGLLALFKKKFDTE